MLESDPLDETEGLDSLWKEIADKMIECAKKVLGETRGVQRKNVDSWFWKDEEVKKAVKEKREAYCQWHRRKGRETWEWYKDKRTNCRRVVAITKMRNELTFRKEVTSRYTP